MNIEIDQSGKIENTNRNTIIAFSNDISSSILITGKDKREIQRIFREAKKPRIFVYRLFATLIFILIKKHIRRINQVTIDLEYPGKSYLIKNYLYQEIRKIKPNFPAENIVFKRIGKKSKAHYVAYGIAIGKKLPNKIVSIKEISKFIVK